MKNALVSLSATKNLRYGCAKTSLDIEIKQLASHLKIQDHKLYDSCETERMSIISESSVTTYSN